ncbi:hypothetical protein K505DRAFT_325359 [Melanomma pulvis-pyrius CBS 109.77]|uniref:Uncharacterized protein n=1 Tax=Melanomma pulvis-pyrius CBS 109.77 TaxID=1314802 RepID=A0A6A6XAW9_9PLEO|nr:hypothetical protein K505DRAFT_325359 [Melanomma pulvis-pyrius CBS 109.77]
MAFSFNNRQRQDFVDIVKALRSLEEDPEQLRLQRAQRYHDPPPAYPSSGETTQPPSPVEASAPDEATLQAQRNRTMFQSTPSAQFKSQTTREIEHIIYQRQEWLYGRKQTLPFDITLDFLANAENNIRARWVEQGIWKEEWGSAWPKGAKASDNRWVYSRQNTGGPSPLLRWGHEEELEPKPASEPELEAKREINIFDEWGQKEPNSANEGSGHTSIPDVTTEPAGTIKCDTSASRPYNQFLFQVSKESEWITDQLQYKRPTGMIDIDNMAYTSIKSNWLEDDIWNPEWGELPGMTWMHEDLLEELRQKSRPEFDAVNKDEQQPDLPSPESFDPNPTSSVHNDCKMDNHVSSAPKDVEASSGVSTRGRNTKRKGIARLPPISERAWPTEELGSRVLRRVRSSKVMKPSESRSSLTNTRFRRGRDANSAPGDEQSSVRPLRTSRRSSLASKNTTLGRPLKSSDAGQRSPSVKAQLPVASGVTRRSGRLAAQMRKPEAGSKQSYKTSTTAGQKRKTAASSTSVSKAPSQSTIVTPSITADIHRIKKRQCGSKGEAKRRR